ncbi:MAG: multiheme c-type cytochrome [Phycisphaeraceae bacterium]
MKQTTLYRTLAACAIAIAMTSGAAHAQIISIDHTKVIGNDEKGGNCGACHQKEVAAWKETPHFRSLDKLKDGKAIADKLGLGRSYRKTGFCVECHSTAKGADPQDLETVSGVSCESCHGPAADWLKLHNDYGTGSTKDTETAEHKKTRHAAADKAGMIRKDRVYLIAKNCFSCHLVPNEQLVNQGGHKTSSDFELVAWSHGEVRHNYFNSDTNKNTSAERKRVLYVVGRVVDLEMSIAGATKITEKGHYRSAILNRIRNATTNIDAILAAAKDNVPEIKAVLDEVPRRDDGSLALSAEMLTELPKKLGAAAQKFVENNDGSKLGAIDPLLPKPDEYKGAVTP